MKSSAFLAGLLATLAVASTAFAQAPDSAARAASGTGTDARRNIQGPLNDNERIDPADPPLSGINVSDAAFLPIGESVFTFLETIAPPLISDRFTADGLYTGQAARIGGFLTSSSQTLFRFGDVSVSDPTGSGAPLIYPEWDVLQQAIFRTQLIPAPLNAMGLAVVLAPIQPTGTWTRTVSVATSHLGGGVPGTDAPAVTRMGGWDRFAATATGPLNTNMRGAFTASWAHGSQFFRAEPDAISSTHGTALANVSITASDRDEIRTLGMVQHASYPLAVRRAFAGTGETADSVQHMQAAWERDGTRRSLFYGAYTHQSRESDADMSRVVFERLLDGPTTLATSVGSRTIHQWTAGARISPRDMNAPHALEAGIEMSGARSRELSSFSGAAGELVNGLPARVWQFAAPPAASLRRTFTSHAYALERFTAHDGRFKMDASLALNSVSGSADGSATNIQWHTLLPRFSARMNLTETFDLFAGVGRSAYQLPLDVLAYGDPNAPTADVFKWNAPAGPAPPLSALGPLVSRMGPGTHGDATFSAIDPDLERPYTDELVIGMDWRVRKDLLIHITGVARHELNLLGTLNTGVPSSAYSVLTFPDMNINVMSPDDDQILTAYPRLPQSFGQDRYFLTNPDELDATSQSFEISIAYFTRRVTLIVGGTASQTDGAAANRGYTVLENDHGVVGELFFEPNATQFARGRLFHDRAFTGKLVGTFELPKAVQLGFVARYQDGQPFARVLVVPELNQGADAVRAYINGGSRFMFVGTFDLRVQKRFAIGRDGRYKTDIVLDVFNLPNMSNEVEEDITTGPGFRTITAVQPSRSIQLGFRVTF